MPRVSDVEMAADRTCFQGRNGRCFDGESLLKHCRDHPFRATIYPVRLKYDILLLILAALLLDSAHAQAPRYEYREQHSPDGIGKFYMGREISHVMGHLAADWLERPERNVEENTELLIQSLPVKPGDVIADIGAGTGYFTRQLADRKSTR